MTEVFEEEAGVVEIETVMQEGQDSTTLVAEEDIIDAYSEAPIVEFSDLGLDTRLTQALTKMGIETPTAIQSQSIPIALSGKDILARAPTGSGKTLSYVLPVLHMMARHWLCSQSFWCPQRNYRCKFHR